MNNALKIIALLISGAFTLGFGLCSLMGISSVPDYGNNEIYLMILLGISLTALFGWLFVSIAKSFKSSK